MQYPDDFVQKEEANDYFLRIERKDSDLPFYNGKPMHIRGKGWLIILGFTLTGFLYLSLGYLPLLDPITNRYVSAVMLPLLGLIGLAIATKEHWPAIFRRPRLGDLWIIPLFTLGSLLFSFLLATLASAFFPMASNPAALEGGAAFSWAAFFNMHIQDLFQLFGEELLAIFPLLGLFQLFYNKTKMNRKKSLIIALLLSSLLFGALHLPTYQWNIMQCLLVIGLGRVLDSLSYVVTRNVWVSFAVHYIYDFVLFTLPLLFA